MSIKIEEDRTTLDLGPTTIILSGMDKLAFKEEDDHLWIYGRVGEREYVNHRLYHNPTDHQVKMELTE